MSLKLYAPYIALWKEGQSPNFHYYFNIIVPTNGYYPEKEIVTSFTQKKELLVEIFLLGEVQNQGTTFFYYTGKLALSDYYTGNDCDSVKVSVAHKTPDNSDFPTVAERRKIKASTANVEICTQNSTPELRPHIYQTEPDNDQHHFMTALIPNDPEKKFVVNDAKVLGDNTPPSDNDIFIDIDIIEDGIDNEAILQVSRDFNLAEKYCSVTSVAKNNPSEPKRKQIIKENQSDDKLIIKPNSFKK